MHWCCVAVDCDNDRIYVYDSLNNKKTVASLTAIAENIQYIAKPAYTIVHDQSPIQFDGHSCGIFVCNKFWKIVEPSMSFANGLDYARVKILDLVLNPVAASDA